MANPPYHHRTAEGVETSTLEKRIFVYVMRPRDFEMACCPCSNIDPDWSEFKGHLWCHRCWRDFVPVSYTHLTLPTN